MRISPAIAPALLLILALSGCASNPETLVTNCDMAGDPLRGVSVCTAAAKADNLSPYQRAKILSDLGYYFNLLGHYDKAVAALDRSIELNPDMGGTYNRRGYAYRGKRDWQAALKDFNRAIEMLWDVAEPRRARGRVYFEMGRIDDAMADYDKALALDPKDIYSYNERGYTYWSQKKFDLAVAEYKRALAIDPNFSNGRQNLATAYFDLKEYELAIKEYDHALRLDPWNIYIYAQRAEARVWNGDLDGAAKDAQTFLARMDELKDKPYDLDPATFKTYTLVLLGMIEIKKKDYAAAIGSFDQAIEDNPESAQAYYLRAAAHRLAGDQADADADYRKALELDPQINDKMKAWLEG